MGGKSSPIKKYEMADNLVGFTSVHFLMSHSNKSLDPSCGIGVAIHLRQKNCNYHHTQKPLYRVQLTAQCTPIMRVLLGKIWYDGLKNPLSN